MLDKERLEPRSHVLSLRESELESRLHDRDRAIEDLNLRFRERSGNLRKEHATRELLTRQFAEMHAPKNPKQSCGSRRRVPNARREGKKPQNACTQVEGRAPDGDELRSSKYVGTALVPLWSLHDRSIRLPVSGIDRQRLMQVNTQ
jgi:uncharacterized coiled-coil protein SlyX